MAGRPGQPLPPDLDQFVARHSHGGVVVVSFGSIFEHVPDDVSATFCSSFRRLPIDVGIIWKHNKPNVCQPDLPNLLALPWIPQNDLLADDRVKVLVTHAGISSVVEAAYHGKPLVVVPLSLDQPNNAAAAVQRGFAERVELSDSDFGAALFRAVERVLGEKSYADEARHAAGLFAEQHDRVGVRMSAAIGAVVRHGTKHVRSAGAYELNVYQFLMIDVYLALFVGVLLVLFGFYVMIKLVCWVCCGQSKGGKYFAPIIQPSGKIGKKND